MPRSRIKKNRALALTSLLLGVLSGTGFAQDLSFGGGYVVVDEVALPDTAVVGEATGIPQSPNRMDVKAIGMGKTQVANGGQFNAMMDNPALLSRKRVSIDLFGMQASIPQATLDAAKFVKDNQDQFTDGTFYNQINQGYAGYQNAGSIQERLDAIALINEGLRFPNQLLKETVGSQDDPTTHGINAIPNMQVQLGRWGATLYSTTQIGFQVSPGNSIDQLLSLQIPQDAEDLSPEVLKTLGGVVSSVFEADGSLASEGLPQVFATTYLDVVGAVGYAHQVRPDLEVGANLKMLHRRFTTKNIDANNLDNILSEAADDLKRSVTGLTMDVGALYHYQKTGTRFGLAIQNLVPVKKITSTASFAFVNSQEYYLTDEAGEAQVGFVDLDGNFFPDSRGDTLLYAETQRIQVQAPLQLKVPLLVNAGATHPLRDNWDLSLDWVDMFAQDDKYDHYLGRIHVGTEYRVLKGLLALRGGFADEHPTLGASLSLKILQVDAAYAYDNFIGDNAYFIQLKTGW
ncbi:MAG: conjugal transfer protein TraF [Candidatus Latescibacteria bacterium]|nr:conjugal transfer protein TraF [Candidatus Latescibacterota bacterium]